MVVVAHCRGLGTLRTPSTHGDDDVVRTISDAAEVVVGEEKAVRGREGRRRRKKKKKRDKKVAKLCCSCREVVVEAETDETK